jgi:hypothetical protein
MMHCAPTDSPGSEPEPFLLTLRGCHTPVADPRYERRAMPRPMTLELLETLRIVDDDVTEVVNAYMADPERGPVVIGEGYRIDPAPAVAGHPFASTLMRQPWASDELRRAAVRAAILMAEPERA